MDFVNSALHIFNDSPLQLRQRAEATLRALAPGFSVSWFRSEGTRIWYAMLKPKDWVRDRFGLFYEYLIVANHFNDDFHVRTLENDVDHRVAYRLDRQLRFVASDAPGVADICATWARDQQVSIVVLTADAEQAIEGGQPREQLELLLASKLWVRDRFDDSEPVRSPGEFFGREALVNDAMQRLSEGQPVSIMGLRKIGKSSVMRRVEDRLLGSDGYVAVTAFVNCNGADVKASHWSYLVSRLVTEWTRAITRIGIQRERPVSLNKVRAVSDAIAKASKLVDDGEVARAFQKDFARLHKAAANLAGDAGRVRFVAFLDEADHLHPESPDALHWRDGFFSFWDTLQALKRGLVDSRALTWMLGGVNPSFVETGAFGCRPNPLFETAVEYLKPMTEDEASDLLNGLGRPMGLTFDKSAIGEVFGFTGGHPWLLRRAGSLVHRNKMGRVGLKDVGAMEMKRLLSGNKAKFLSHVDWILGHLARIAPDEHALLRDLCIQGPSVYEDDWLDREFRDVFAQHLEEYGLLRFDDDRPQVAVQLIAEAFLKHESGGLGEQKKRLREAVDGLESAIRFRLRNDLQFPVSSEQAQERRCRTTEDVISTVVNAIPKSGRGRGKSSEELLAIGQSNGIAALFDALNWDDYVILIEKYYLELRLMGNPGEAGDFARRLRNDIAFAHTIRHNNDSALQREIEERGFGGCMRRILNMRTFFSD
jgi:hypothetical protein